MCSSDLELVAPKLGQEANCDENGPNRRHNRATQIKVEPQREKSAGTVSDSGVHINADSVEFVTAPINKKATTMIVVEP